MQFRHACLTLAVAVTTLCSAALAAPLKFDIPSQPASAALMAFSKQARVEVVFAPDDLKPVQTPALRGEYEPEEALALLLKDSGFTASRNSGGKFVVTRAKPRTGAVGGTALNTETGKPIEGAKIRVVDAAQIAVSDHSGRFRLAEVPPGTYSLVVLADDFLPTRVTDVVVRPDQEVKLGLVDVRPRRDGVTKLAEYVVSARKDVVELESYEVSDSKVKPFAGSNVDVPRTNNDVQPYYVFDAQSIESSGAVNVEDFLKQRLTMNAIIQTSAQQDFDPRGNTSSVNLRGLGSDKTLILVNGRRMAGVQSGSATGQFDLNGIPLSAIDRIEVLPSAASGIYGGSALGGVVNVILKQGYAGGEIRATYDNTFDTDSARRTVAFAWGQGFEDGKTHVQLTASWSDAHPLWYQDRRALYDRGFAYIQRNSPGFFFAANQAPLGALANLYVSGATATLTLKGSNLPLNSRFTYVPAGTSATTSMADLQAGLLANAGKYNQDLPPTVQSPTGLRRQLGAIPRNRSLLASVRRQMWAKVEAFVDFSSNENDSSTLFSPFPITMVVPFNAPTNPFTTSVTARFPSTVAYPYVTESLTRSVTAGVVVTLPHDWVTEADYTWSRSSYFLSYADIDLAAQFAAIASGALNPFVDTLRYPIGQEKYLVPRSSTGVSTLQDFALRGAGPLPSLPWGAPRLTVGLEHRVGHVPESTTASTFPLTPANNSTSTTFARDQSTDSGYAELLFPLVKTGWLPGVHALELQASVRQERYTVDGGTTGLFSFPGFGFSFYTGPTLNGQPFFTKARYTSTNETAGVKYQPVRTVTVRASVATAFLPPDPAQLVKNPLPDSFPTTVLDPRNGAMVDVNTIGGGNPSLKPQNAESFNAGVIWEPAGPGWDGLRLNVEYYRIKQFDSIATLGAQAILNQERLFPGRVTRDAAGNITLIDTSMVNLYRRDTSGWDLSVDYRLKLGGGALNLRAAASLIRAIKEQYDQAQPMLDSAGFPSEGGAAKFKGNTTVSWEARRWTAGWTLTHYGPYQQYGAPGGPDATQIRAADPTAPLTTAYTVAQGGNTVPSQTYHDVFASYAFGKIAGSGAGWRALDGWLRDGLSVQVGVRNVLGQKPPVDVYYPFYASTYGDIRLRSYWVTVKKAF